MAITAAWDIASSQTMEFITMKFWPVVQQRYRTLASAPLQYPSRKERTAPVRNSADL